MTNNIYLGFNDPSSPANISKGRIQEIAENIFVKILSTIVPNANPDYGHLIDKVVAWKIEYNLIKDAVTREIGYDQQGNAIVAMPNKNNYGYWTDNQLKLIDYNRFDPQPVSAEHFEKEWGLFINSQ